MAEAGNVAWDMGHKFLLTDKEYDTIILYSYSLAEGHLFNSLLRLQ